MIARRASLATLEAEKQRTAKVAEKQTEWRRSFEEQKQQQQMTVEVRHTRAPSLSIHPSISLSLDRYIYLSLYRSICLSLDLSISSLSIYTLHPSISLSLSSMFVCSASVVRVALQCDSHVRAGPLHANTFRRLAGGHVDSAFWQASSPRVCFPCPRVVAPSSAVWYRCCGRCVVGVVIFVSVLLSRPPPRRSSRGAEPERTPWRCRPCWSGT